MVRFVSKCMIILTNFITFTFFSGDGNGLGLGWQTWYTGSGFNKNEGASPVGDSFHLTSLPGASVSLSFYGMRFQLLYVSLNLY